MSTMKELKPVNVTTTPEVLRLAQEVARSGVPMMLKTDSEDLAALSPVTPKAPARRRRTDPPARDSLLNIIGIGESAEPTDIAKHKHDYLAEAYERTNP